MIHILHILALLFWLALIPYGIGLIPANLGAVKRRSAGFILLAGYFTMWALFEVVAIPAVLFVKYDNFKVASACFMIASMVCAAAGVWLFFRNRKKERDRSADSAGIDAPEWSQQENNTNVSSIKSFVVCCHKRLQNMPWAERIEWTLFFALLAFQLYKAAAYASFDGDDAYYVVESLIAQQADVMYRILPYTGRPTDLDIRHALAVFPMWVAFIAQQSGIHATIVSHTILPFVLISLTYLVYYEIGKRLFGSAAYDSVREETVRSSGRRAGFRGQDGDSVFHRENLPIFMILMAMFQIFGNVSIYTNETFFLTRTWQGKAVAGSLVIPALIWIFLSIAGGKVVRQDDMQGRAATMQQRHGDAGLWFTFVCINMTAGICSSIAVFLVCILMALTAFVLAVTERRFRIILQMGAVCIPNVIYMAVYVIVAYSYLLR